MTKNKITLKAYSVAMGWKNQRYGSKCCKNRRLDLLRGVSKAELITPPAGSPYWLLTLKKGVTIESI